ncbi:MAG TPA: MerR family transcriptional regulator [Bacillota bacterium]|nr:MerR family transcriptional regulator [Bacillota bacterium]
MKKGSYQIDEVARQTGLTKRSIRYYEELGLIQPTRTESGYRLYSEDDLMHLKRIVILRDTTGFSLKDIKEIFQVEDSIAKIRNVNNPTGQYPEQKELLKNLRNNYLEFLSLVGKKRAQLEEIEQSYQEKLSRLDNILKEME